VVGDTVRDSDGDGDVDGEYSPKQVDGIAATLLNVNRHSELIKEFISRLMLVRLGFAAVVKIPAGSTSKKLPQLRSSDCNFDRLAKIVTGRPQPSKRLLRRLRVLRFGVLSNSPAGRLSR
jgi:hypothetical protein